MLDKTKEQFNRDGFADETNDKFNGTRVTRGTAA